METVMKVGSERDGPVEWRDGYWMGWSSAAEPTSIVLGFGAVAEIQFSIQTVAFDTIPSPFPQPTIARFSVKSSGHTHDVAHFTHHLYSCIFFSNGIS
jgi:hypothetical protein